MLELDDAPLFTVMNAIVIRGHSFPASSETIMNFVWEIEGLYDKHSYHSSLQFLSVACEEARRLRRAVDGIVRGDETR